MSSDNYNPTKFEEDFASKSELPSWFSAALKTRISKNITLEEWNSVQQYLKNLSADDITFKKAILHLLQYACPMTIHNVTLSTVSTNNVVINFSSIYVQIIDKYMAKYESLNDILDNHPVGTVFPCAIQSMSSSGVYIYNSLKISEVSSVKKLTLIGTFINTNRTVESVTYTVSSIASVTDEV